MRKKTKHAAESNENLISDEINVNLSVAKDETRKSLRPHKQTRNNNYFSASGKKMLMGSPKPSDTRSDGVLLDEEDDEEEELIVG